jgi:hypothetical protein
MLVVLNTGGVGFTITLILVGLDVQELIVATAE